MVKRIFAVLVVFVQVATVVYGLLAMVGGFSLSLAGLLVIAGAPLVQRLAGLDTLRVEHHKVRLPATSALVLLALALVLLTTGPASGVMGLALLNVGLFLLDTYWRRS